MFGIVADLQAGIIGALLLWAGSWKLFDQRSGDVATRSTLALVFRRKSTLRVVYRLMGAPESTVGLLLLLPPHYWWEMRMATGVAVGFVLYLLFSRLVAPGRPCACLGRREAAVSWRTLSRAGLVLVLTVMGWPAHQFWLTTMATHPWSLSVVALEVLVLIGLSPEVKWAWMTWRQGQTRVVPECATAAVPLSDTLRYLQGSTPFQEFSRFLRSEVVDHWREGCWRFVCYTADYDSRAATAVFAVPILRKSGSVRAALVDEADGMTLLTVGPSIFESTLASVGSTPASQ